MILIHSTNRLISELKINVQPKDNNHINTGLGDWYANIFDFNRRYCLLYTNSKTLVSFIVPDLLKKDLKNFLDFYIKGVQDILTHAGINKGLIERIMVEYIHIQIVTTESKAVLGSMNDFVQDYKFIFGKDKHRFIKTIQHFNQNILEKPMGALKFATPLERMKELINEEYK